MGDKHHSNGNPKKVNYTTFPVTGLLTVDPTRRYSLAQLSRHPWLRQAQTPESACVLATELPTPTILPRSADETFNATYSAFISASREGFQLVREIWNKHPKPSHLPDGRPNGTIACEAAWHEAAKERGFEPIQRCQRWKWCGRFRVEPSAGKCGIDGIRQWHTGRRQTEANNAGSAWQNGRGIGGVKRF